MYYIIYKYLIEAGNSNISDKIQQKKSAEIEEDPPSQYPMYENVRCTDDLIKGVFVLNSLF